MIRSTSALLALLGMASSSMAASAPSVSTVPAIPELGPKSAPLDILRCERNYEYRHKVLPCDSPVAADGEGLRPLLETVPAARAELEIYQSNRRSLGLTAYTGMAGLLVAVLGPRLIEERKGKNVAITIGLSLTLGSLAFGKSRLAVNEAHLDRAVSHFNDAHPEDPITLLQPGAPRPAPLPTPLSGGP